MMERKHNWRYKRYFRLEKQTKAVKDRILRDIKNLYQHEEKEKKLL